MHWDFKSIMRQIYQVIPICFAIRLLVSQNIPNNVIKSAAKWIDLDK